MLLAIGVVMVYSASAISAQEFMKDSAYYLKRHLLYLIIGIVTSLMVMSVDYVSLKKYVKPVLIATFFLLLLVLIPGISREIAGARRWFRFSFLSFQPSQVCKIVMILYFADFLSRKQGEIKSFWEGFVPPMIILGFSVGLILLEPDLGTAVAISAVSFMMLFVAGIKLRHLVPMLLGSIPVLGVLIFHKAYRMRRIVAFWDPWKDPQGVGFQIIQSFIALGSGGPFGVGLGQSRQKLLYLPGAHTDFIFSIIGEELGFIGTASIVILFGLFVWQGMKIVFKAAGTFERLLSLGIVSLIALEAIINIGVTAGALPTKGLPLPFISYGGSGLIFHLAAIGILLNIAKNSEMCQ